MTGEKSMHSTKDIIASGLSAVYEGFKVFNAGIPYYPRNFSRDSIIAGILSGDGDTLKNQLSFSAFLQGKAKDPKTGEEPGKIFHEYPPVNLGTDSLVTKFNACDTTALFLIGHSVYRRLTGDAGLATEQRANIEAAAKYIVSHIKDDLFAEDPRLSGADRFALNVTYWKDSVAPERQRGQVAYPAVFTLAHVQNTAGLRAAASLLGDEHLSEQAERMKEATANKLYDAESGSMLIAKDKIGPIKGITSDQLHMLFYMREGDMAGDRMDSILQSSAELKTPIGYRTMAQGLSKSVSDPYHATTVWPFEQAIINAGAAKHRRWAESQGLELLARRLAEAEEVSGRIVKGIDGGSPEYLKYESGRYVAAGCDPTLWSIAAKKYFANTSAFIGLQS